jgi:hypothetical protein
MSALQATNDEGKDNAYLCSLNPKFMSAAQTFAILSRFAKAVVEPDSKKSRGNNRGYKQVLYKVLMSALQATFVKETNIPRMAGSKDNAYLCSIYQQLMSALEGRKVSLINTLKNSSFIILIPKRLSQAVRVGSSAQPAITSPAEALGGAYYG